MIDSLPNAIIYLDAVKSTDNNSQQLTETTNSRRAKSTVLARLLAIKQNLDFITVQPASGSDADKNLIKIRQQYKAILPSISSSVTVEEARSQLNSAKDKLDGIKKMVIQCNSERTAKGMGSDLMTEKNTFCATPIVSGYSHGDIIRPDDSNQHGALKFTMRNSTNDNGAPGFESLPMVNAKAVYGDNTSKFTPPDVDIDCNIIYKANDVDYKHAGDLLY